MLLQWRRKISLERACRVRLSGTMTAVSNTVVLTVVGYLDDIGGLVADKRVEIPFQNRKRGINT